MPAPLSSAVRDRTSNIKARVGERDERRMRVCPPSTYKSKSRTRSAEQDHRPWNIVLLQSSSEGEGDGHTCHRDEIMPTGMSDPRQCIHLGVHADDASESESPRAAALEFCAPGGGEAEVLPGHREAARGHELGQAIVRVSA